MKNTSTTKSGPGRRAHNYPKIVRGDKIEFKRRNRIRAVGDSVMLNHLRKYEDRYAVR